MLLVFEDITDRKRRERDALMLTNEVSHRIKNNLQIVIGLIAYEIKLTTAASVPGLKAMQSRIGAIAQLYDLISQSSRGESIAIDAYLSSLAIPADKRANQRFATWFDATEQYPRQLHELDRQEYLQMKKNEYQRQQTAQ